MNGASDGAGIWDSGTATDWYTGSADEVWPQASGNTTTAVFGSGGTAGTVTVASTIDLNGITFNSGVTGSYDITSGTLDFGGTTPTITVNTNAEIDSVIAGSSGLTFIGSGPETLILNGPNTWTGGATITTGTVQVNSSGNLGSSANTLTLGSGVAGTATNLGLLINNPSLTVASIVYTGSGGIGGTSSVTNNATINIPSGDAFTDTGALIVGGSGATENLTFTGAGNFTAGSKTTSISLDGTGSPLSFHSAGTTTLADGTNTLTANVFDFADSKSNNGSTGTLKLGQGVNIIQAGLLNIGLGKSAGTIEFSGPGGTLTLTGSNGVGSTVNIFIGEGESASYASAASQLLLAGHSAFVQAGNVVIGEENGSTNTTPGGPAGSITFDTGTFSANSMILAQYLSNSSGSPITSGTFTLGTNSSSTGVLDVSSTFELTAAGKSGLTQNGIFNINGGAANIGTNITNSGTGSTINAIINLNGGLLNMMGHSIGSSTAAVTLNLPTSGTAEIESLAGLNGTGGITQSANSTLIIGGANSYSGATTVTSGTLQLGDGVNATSFTNTSISASSNGTLVVDPANGGSISRNISNGATINAIQSGAGTLSGAISGAGVFNQNGSGITTLSGANTYSGATTINNGTLVVTGSLLSSGTVTLNDTSANPVLAGNGNGITTGLVGDVILPADSGPNYATIAPGTTGTSTSFGELTMSSLMLNGGQLVIALTNTNTAGSTYDFINVTGAMTLPTSSAAWTVSPSGGAAGVYTILTGASSNIGSGAALPTINAAAGGALYRPTSYTPSFLGNSLLLTVGGGAAAITWSGTNGSGGNGIWDVNTTQNWNDSSASTPTGTFYDGDAVTFDDTGINTHITVQSGTNGETSVQPSSITVSANTVNYSIGGNPISGATGLLKTGSDTLTLSGSNTFTGATTIQAGIVNYQNGAAFGVSSAITVESGATAQLQGGIASPGGSIVTLSGSGALGATGALENVSGNNSSASPIALGTDSIISSDAGSLTLSGGITGTGNLTLQSQSSGNGAITLSGVGVNNTGAITNAGAGSGTVTISSAIGPNVLGVVQDSPTSLLTLSASSTFTTGVTITTGTVDATASGALGTGPVSIASPATLVIGVTGTFANAMSGAGIVDFNTLGAGEADALASGNLSGFTGTLNIGPGGGKLQLNQASAGAIISSSATINILNGATLFENAPGGPIGANINLYGGTTGEAFGQIRFVNTTLSGTLTLETGTSVTFGADHSTGTIDGPIVDNGAGDGWTEVGSGGLSTIILNGSNTYSGPTVITGTGVNTLRLGNVDAVQNSTVDPLANGQIDGVTFSPGIGTFNIGGLEGPGNIALTDTGGGAVTINVGGNNSSNTYSGVLSGTSTGGFTKVGAGIETLSNSNTYIGATAVQAGTLNLTGSLIGTSGVTVTDATLEGTGFISGAVTIGSGAGAQNSALIIPGGVGLVGTLTTGSSVSLLSDGQFVFNLNSTGGGAGAGSSELLALSVSLDPASDFQFNDIAATPGVLTQGGAYTVIDTTGGLTGVFANLPNGDIISSNGNQFQAQYGTDTLTLVVVPEPATWGMVILGFGMLLSLHRLRKRQMGI